MTITGFPVPRSKVKVALSFQFSALSKPGTRNPEPEPGTPNPEPRTSNDQFFNTFPVFNV
jgi:hypothetical protein